MKNTNALAVQTEPEVFSVQQVLAQVELIQQVMKACMKEGEHYGRIPGCGDKPTLLKPGAEKLCLTFRLAPTYDVEERLLDKGHREYTITCTLTSILSGARVGQGVGFGSTMESKYRFRKGAAEATDKPVPRAYWDVRQDDPAKAQELIGGKGFSAKKVDGKGWMIAKGGDLVENDNPANETNTVLKMTKKRALVDAVLTATAASDLLTQDLEDIQTNIATYQPVSVTPEARKAIEQPAQKFEEVSSVPNGDFRETRIHFGKNRGLMLWELTPQQVHWYETDWMPKKEANGPTSIEDLALINALKTYRDWKGSNASKPAPKAKAPKAKEEPSETPQDALERFMAADSITPEEITEYFRQQTHDGWPILSEDETVSHLTDERIAPLVAKWPEHRKQIMSARLQKSLKEAPLN